MKPGTLTARHDRVLAARDEWSKVFGSPHRLGDQASARSHLALALLARGRSDQARSELAEAKRLIVDSEDPEARADVQVAEAKLLAASRDHDAAATLLRSGREWTRRAGRTAEYEAELSLAELDEARRASGWKWRLEGTDRRARHEGFSLYAQRARALLESP